jgi:hypothetical protein
VSQYLGVAKSDSGIKPMGDTANCNRSSKKGQKGNVMTLGRYTGGLMQTRLKMDDIFEAFTVTDYNAYPVVFWVITRRRVVIIYRRFGTTYRSHLHGSVPSSRVKIPRGNLDL